MKKPNYEHLLHQLPSGIVMSDVEKRAVHRLNNGEWVLEKDIVASERPLSIDLKNEEGLFRWVSILRTPGADKELVTGLLVSEGVLKGCTISEIEITLSDDMATVLLPQGGGFDITPRGRIRNGSACGICGRQDFSDLLARVHECSIRGIEIESTLLLELPEKMLKVQSAFTSTGGIHAAGLFTSGGENLVVREDIGRHNCVDKVVGAGIYLDIQFPNTILCLSGRIGSELVLKAIAAEIPAIVAIGAASSMAVDLARQAGIALYGFTRNNSTVSYLLPQDDSVGE